MHGFFAAHGLAAHGLHGFAAAHGLHGFIIIFFIFFLTAQGLQGLHGLSDVASCTGVFAAALAEAIGSTAAPVARVATLRATKVFFNIHASKESWAAQAAI